MAFQFSLDLRNKDNMEKRKIFWNTKIMKYNAALLVLGW